MKLRKPNAAILTEDTIIITIKNPNRRRPNYRFTKQIPHRLFKPPRTIEVLANNNGSIISYAESKSFNDYRKDLMSNFNVIKADKKFIYLEYGFLNEFGINEEINLTIRVY